MKWAGTMKDRVPPVRLTSASHDLRLEVIGDDGGGADVEGAQGPTAVGGVVRRAAHDVDVVGGPPPQRNLALGPPAAVGGVGHGAVHHPLGSGRGAGGVEDQPGPGAAVGVGQRGRGGDGRFVVPTDQEQGEVALCHGPVQGLFEFGVTHDHGHVGIVEDVGQLPGLQVPVDRQVRGVEHGGRGGHLELLRPVGEHSGHRAPGPGALVGQDGGQPAGPVVELTVGVDDVAHDDGRSVRPVAGMGGDPARGSAEVGSSMVGDASAAKLTCARRSGTTDRRPTESGTVAAMTERAGAVGTAAHPLEPLTAEEIRASVAAVRADGRIDKRARFATITLEPPSKEVVAAHRPGDPVRRLVRLIIVPGTDSTVIEAVVAVPAQELVSWVERLDVRPALLFDDSLRSIVALGEDPDWQEAMRRRGITDFDKVQIDPWPTGNFGRAIEENRRITRCLSYYREDPTDNGYARPIEGVIATVDGG